MQSLRQANKYGARNCTINGKAAKILSMTLKDPINTAGQLCEYLRLKQDGEDYRLFYLKSKGVGWCFDNGRGIATGVKPSIDRKHSQVKSQPSKVRASHLLVKHCESRNPVSRNPANDTKGDKIQQRSVHEADQMLLGWLADMNAAQDPKAKFHELAKHSDCGSYKNDGDLGWFEFGSMQRPFSDAAFSLQIGQITQYVVHSASGSHLILRT